MQRIRPLAVLVLLASAACAEPPPQSVVIPPAPPEPPPAAPPLRPLPDPDPPPMQVAAPAEPEPAAPVQVAGATPASGPAWRMLFRDARPRRPGLSTQVLITQIQGLESLFAATPASSPDRPKLIRRLADEYVELAARASVMQATTPSAQASKVASASRTAATKYYQLLESKYPRYCAVPGPSVGSQGSGCLDEALYYGALEMERAGDTMGARMSYLKLLQGFPQSPLVPLGYLAFGEMFFEEAQGDPTKLPLAQQSYLEVLKYPTAAIDVLGYAHYQLGRVLKHLPDPRARIELKKALDWARAHASTPGAAQLADAVRRE